MKFEDIQFNSRRVGVEQYDGVQGFVDLVNGYQLSVVQSPFSYGGKQGLWEIGLMAGNSLVEVSEWHDQVKGYLTKSEVEKEIEWLNKKLLGDMAKAAEKSQAIKLRGVNGAPITSYKQTDRP